MYAIRSYYAHLPQLQPGKGLIQSLAHAIQQHRLQLTLADGIDGAQGGQHPVPPRLPQQRAIVAQALVGITATEVV